MSKLIKEESDTGRLHIDSPLMGESLVSKEFLKRDDEAFVNRNPLRKCFCCKW